MRRHPPRLNLLNHQVNWIVSFLTTKAGLAGTFLFHQALNIFPDLADIKINLEFEPTTSVTPTTGKNENLNH